MSILKSLSLPSKLSSEKGLSLIEILVSMALIAVIGTVAVTIGSGTLLDAQSNQDRARALSYTLEALEEIRSIRDAEPAKLFSLSNGTYVLTEADGLDGVESQFIPESPDTYEEYQIPDTNYYRVITLLSPDCSNMCKEIHVVTYFKEKSVMRSVETTAYLTDWQ